MDPSFGSANQLLGGGQQALQEAMAARSTGQAGATSAVTPSAQSSQAMPPPSVSGGQPSAQPVSSSPMKQALPPGDPEALIIVKTLTKRLNG